MLTIDLNCDMGEGFGVYKAGADQQLMHHITSANIACGFHAGDPSTIRQTVRLALECGVAIGAHPGLQDLAGFGRRAMAITPEEVYDLTVYQIGAVHAFAQAQGGSLAHVKPHGALYNMAAGNRQLAEAVAKAVHSFDPKLILFGLAGSELTLAGEAIGLRTMHEAFADRTYESDGTLTPRSIAGAVIKHSERSAEQVIGLIKHGTVRSRQGEVIPLRADTICIHGDTEGALEQVVALRKALEQAGIEVRRASV